MRSFLRLPSSFRRVPRLRPPLPEQTEPPNETDETEETENTPPPTTQTADKAAEEEFGLGKYGPFGKDGFLGPDPKAEKK